MKLIVISSSKNKPEDPKLMTELFESGLNTFHLRKPSMSTQELAQLIEAVPEHFHDRIVIHSHHKLASRYALKGIHLTGVHKRRKFSTWFRIRALRMKNESLSISTSWHKLGHAYANKKHYDYVLLGSIFDRLSNNFNAGFSEHSLRAVIARTTLRLIARGGTNEDVILRCRDLGFHGVAFSSALWDSPQPIVTWNSILDVCRTNAIQVV